MQECECFVFVYFFVFFFAYMYVCSIPYFFKWVKLREFGRRKIQEILETVQQWKPQTVKNESIEKFVAILVNQKNYCVTSCVTKDMLCYFVWVMNFNFVWKSHIKTQLNQSIKAKHQRGLSFDATSAFRCSEANCEASRDFFVRSKRTPRPLIFFVRAEFEFGSRDAKTKRSWARSLGTISCFGIHKASFKSMMT